MRPRLAGLLCIAVAACSYDWTVGASAVDAGGSADGAVDGATPGPDAAQNDASDEDVVALDAMSDGSPVDCSALDTQIQQYRAQIVACTSGPSACMATVNDECGCKVVVGDSGSMVVSNYEAAVSKFTQASCPHSWCPATCSTPSTGLCLVVDASANAYACQQ